MYECTDVVDGHYRSFNHGRAVEAVMSVLREANSFVQTHQPWLLAKSSDRDDRTALDCILHVGLESARVATLALSPVTPGLSRRIIERLGRPLTECTRQHMTQWVAGSHQLGPDSGPLLARIKPSVTLTSDAAQYRTRVWQRYTLPNLAVHWWNWNYFPWKNNYEHQGGGKLRYNDIRRHCGIFL